MKTSYRRLQVFIGVADVYLRTCKGETKLKYAINKILKRKRQIDSEYMELQEDVEMNNANIGPNGSVLFTTAPTGKREYEFTPEGLKKCREQLKELYNSERFEIEPYIVPIPKGLEPSLLPHFAGLVVEFQEEEEVEPEEELEDSEEVNS